MGLDPVFEEIWIQSPGFGSEINLKYTNMEYNSDNLKNELWNCFDFLRKRG